MTTAAEHACLVCGRTEWIPLPDPAPRSMASDWRVVDERLARMLCAACGLVRREPSANAGTAFFSSGYSLYAHSPGDARERLRQSEYARWIAQAVGRRPRRVLDIGCGNGSLLRAFREYWPETELLGCDPSPESIVRGSGDGLRLWTGTASDLPADVTTDLVVSVNVIEHTQNPLEFLNAVRESMEPDARLVVVCPDGGRPGLDLLFVDHLFSFGREHLAALLPRAGLECLATSSAPKAVGAFQMAVGQRRGSATEAPVRVQVRAEDHVRYLERWRQLDDRLRSRIEGSTVCFGAGEAAGLLRAYAPGAWASVRACTVDGDSQGQFGDRPIIPLDSVRPDETLLVGVRPSDQARVAERLAARFPRVVTWYDLVDDESHA